MKQIRVEDRLPKNNEYVLIHLQCKPWSDPDDPTGKRFWKVAEFVRGISKDEREAMRRGSIEDQTEITWTCPTPPGIMIPHESRRSNLCKMGDEDGNNTVPYVWKEFGPDCHFGHEVDVWCELPLYEKSKGEVK